MTFKVVKQINPIGEMKTFIKPNCDLCMEEHIKILKKLRDKRAKLINNNFNIYGACQKKTTFRQLFLSTYDPI